MIIHTHTIHVSYIFNIFNYLHLLDVYGQCRQIYLSVPWIFVFFLPQIAYWNNWSDDLGKFDHLPEKLLGGWAPSGWFSGERITTIYFSHEVRFIGRGPTTRNFRGFTNNGYKPLTKWDDPPSSQQTPPPPPNVLPPEIAGLVIRAY